MAHAACSEDIGGKENMTADVERGWQCGRRKHRLSAKKRSTWKKRRPELPLGACGGRAGISTIQQMPTAWEGESLWRLRAERQAGFWSNRRREWWEEMPLPHPGSCHGGRRMPDIALQWYYNRFLGTWGRAVCFNFPFLSVTLKHNRMCIHDGGAYC